MAVDEGQIDKFAEVFRRFLERMARPSGEGPSLAERLAEHLGVDPIGLSAISESFELWEQANVQAALDAYLAQPGHEAQLVGVLGGQKRGFGVGLSDLLVTRALSVAGPSGGSRSGPVDYVNVTAGPGRSLVCIQFGVVLITSPKGRLAVLIRTGDERSGPMGAKVTIDVMAPEPERATAFLAGFRTLMVRADGVVTQAVASEALALFEVDESGLDKVDRAILGAVCRRPGGPVHPGHLRRGGTRNGGGRL